MFEPEDFWRRLDHHVAELVQLELAELVGESRRELGPPGCPPPRLRPSPGGVVQTRFTTRAYGTTAEASPATR